MTKLLEGKIALVTGASRGIGYALSKVLAEQGAHIIAVAQTVGGLEDLDDDIKALGSSATLVPLDLKDYDGIDRNGQKHLRALWPYRRFSWQCWYPWHSFTIRPHRAKSLG